MIYRSGFGQDPGTYLDQSKGLLRGPPDRQIVDGDVADDSGSVDDEQAPEGDPVVLPEDAEIPGSVPEHVGEDRDVDGPEAALVPRGVDPRHVGKLRVG